MPVEGLDEFERTVREFAAGIGPQLVAPLQRTLTLQVLDGVVKMTPVGRRELWAANITRKEKGLKPLPEGYLGGHARANWQVTLGGVPIDTVDAIDESGELTIAKGSATAQAIPPFSVAFVTNNVAYIEELEDGHSTQAPEGMAAKTLERVRAQFGV
ncbi:MAG: hypothetical protein IT459_19200 [Planctomycetes bacterium]|nr:hypothetical protein [Planctomycetota bacterium]